MHTRSLFLFLLLSSREGKREVLSLPASSLSLSIFLSRARARSLSRTHNHTETHVFKIGLLPTHILDKGQKRKKICSILA